jgi:hypothetical protein
MVELLRVLEDAVESEGESEVVQEEAPVEGP